jgi:fucose permease
MDNEWEEKHVRGACHVEAGMLPTMIRNIKAVTGSCYLSMLFLGIGGAVVGAAARNIGLTPSQIGLIIAIQNVGFGLAVWLSGALSDTTSKPRLLLIGSLILGFGFLTFYVSPLFGVNLGVMFLIGIGMGVFEGITDALLFDLHEARAPYHINVNHFFVTFGAALIAFYLIFLEDRWRVAMVQSGVAILLLAGFFALARVEQRNTPQPSYRERMRAITSSPLLTRLFVISVVLVGADVAAMGIMTTYLVELRGFSQVGSKVALVIFLAGVASGRLVIGRFADVARIPRILLMLFGLATVTFTVLFGLNLGPLTYVVAYLAGLTMSALLPLILAYAGARYREMAGTVMGAIKVAFPIGGAITPFLIGLAAAAFSLQAAVMILPFSMAMGFVLALPVAASTRVATAEA